MNGSKITIIVGYVAEHPGCTKLAAGSAAWYSDHGTGIRPNLDRIYNPVDRAIKSGLIRAERAVGVSNRYALYPV